MQTWVTLASHALLGGDLEFRESFWCSGKSTRLGVQVLGGSSHSAIDWSCGHKPGTTRVWKKPGPSTNSNRQMVPLLPSVLMVLGS